MTDWTDTYTKQVEPARVELLGLGVMVTVMERLGDDERRRVLNYLTDRYAADRHVADLKGEPGA